MKHKYCLRAMRFHIKKYSQVNFETLAYVCRHLTRVVSHSDSNKMDLKNVAIVFGPTLVRTADDNMLAMVTDMAHQCRIIESILNHCEWFFAEPADGEGEDGDQHMQVGGGTISGFIRGVLFLTATFYRSLNWKSRQQQAAPYP